MKTSQKNHPNPQATDSSRPEKQNKNSGNAKETKSKKTQQEPEDRKLAPREEL
jgi:hypothetical protein